MPTGYTAKICEGEQSMSEFVLGCARAFGACVSQRDDPVDDLPKIPEVEESYYATTLRESEQKLKDLFDRSDEEKESQGIKEQKAQIKYYEKEIKKRKIVRDRLDKMYARVKAWVPPSAEHVNLKEFMLEQLETTIKHDGDISYYEECLEKEKEKKPIDYHNEEVESAKYSIKYSKKGLAEEQERHTDRSQWIKQLYNSLEDDEELTHLLLKKGIQV